MSDPNSSPMPYDNLGPLSAATPAPAGSPSSRITVPVQHGRVPVADGVGLHYASAGQGPPVELLPGWPQSWYAWRSVIPRLVEQGRKVYAVDTRGFGDSDTPAGGYDLETLGHDIHVFIQRLGLAHEGGVDIVSHDTGS